MKILEIAGLTASYGVLPVLKGIDLDLKVGSILGLIGLNGAGKTTLIKACLGFLPAESKTMLFCDPNDGRSWDITRRGFVGERKIVSRVGYLSERFQAIDALTPWEYLYFTARSYGLSRSEAEAAVDQSILDVRLKKDQHRRCSELSKGTQQKVGIARCLISNPALILLDEPTTSLDPESRRDLINLLQRLARSNAKTFLISSHILSELSEMCDEFCFLRDGKIWDRFSRSELNSRGHRYLHIQLDGIRERTFVNLPQNAALEFLRQDSHGDRIVLRITQESFDAAAYLRVLVLANHQIASFQIVSESLDDWFMRRIVEAKMEVS